MRRCKSVNRRRVNVSTNSLYSFSFSLSDKMLLKNPLMRFSKKMSVLIKKNSF